MPHRVVVTPRARDQLIGLFDYIADTASPTRAETFTSAILDHLDILAAHPQIGAPRDDLRPGLRTLAFRGRVTIAFVVDGDVIAILGVYYAGQDFEALLRDD